MTGQWRSDVQGTVELESRKVAFNGSCLCGAVRFSGRELREVVYCHCAQCRRFHGHTAAYSATDKDQIKITRDETLRWYESSPRARRGFCAVCGSSLFWDPVGKPYICIAAGAIDDCGALRAARHVYVADKCRYYDISDDLPQFQYSMHG